MPQIHAWWKQLPSSDARKDLRKHRGIGGGGDHSAKAVDVCHSKLSSSSQLLLRRHVHLLCTEAQKAKLGWVQDHWASLTCGHRADACSLWGYITRPSAIRDHLHQTSPAGSETINCLTLISHKSFECILFVVTSFLLLLFFISLRNKKHFSWRSLKSHIDWEKNVLIDHYNPLTCACSIVSRWIDKLGCGEQSWPVTPDRVIKPQSRV